MDWYYELSKYLHIVFATGWLGGGLALVMLGIRAQRARDGEEYVRIIRNMLYLAQRLFVPGALLALIFGAIAAWLAGFYWQEWIVIGLIGFALTFTLGIAVLKPSGDRLVAQADKEGASPDVVRQCMRILRIAKFDHVMLFTVAFDMVFKPTFADWGIIVAMAVVVAGSALLFLAAPAGRRVVTALSVFAIGRIAKTL
jgi:uncharacterized membrane protein